MFRLIFFRPVKDVCGFSRETVVAVTTNVESMEFCRRQNGDIGYEEHPRAGTTDDVEAIIACLHRMLGAVFTLKQFKAGWKQVVRYAWTSSASLSPYYSVSLQNITMGATTVIHDRVVTKDMISTQMVIGCEWSLKCIKN